MGLYTFYTSPGTVAKNATQDPLAGIEPAAIALRFRCKNLWVNARQRAPVAQGLVENADCGL
jgi:hypothetical protein